MKHLEMVDFAKLLSEGPPFAEFCRHLAEACPTCGERLAEVEALMRRFRHWDAETVVREEPAAAELLESLLAKGTDCAAWCSVMKEDGEYQTWCVAWVALERAQNLIAVGGAHSSQARDLALLAAAITEHLGASYHPDCVFDLKALAHATAAAAAGPPATAAADTLRQVAAAVAALDQGTGDPTVARDVMDLLSRVFRKAAEGSLAHVDG